MCILVVDTGSTMKCSTLNSKDSKVAIEDLIRDIEPEVDCEKEQ